MNTDDGEDYHDPDIVKKPTGAAYNIEPWENGGGRGNQCSQNGMFCFLCMWSPSEDEGDEDYWSQIDHTISTLAEEGKELPTITSVVYYNYVKGVKDNIVFYDPRTEQEIHSPEWTKASISRHIMHSPKWPMLFDTVCENILVSLISRQNNSVVDLESGEVLEENRKALLDTIAHYRQFKKHRREATSAAKASARKS